jgi:uncharacterized protein (TIGR02246 family)
MKRRTVLKRGAAIATTAAVAKSAHAQSLAIPGHANGGGPDVDDIKAMLDQSAREWSKGDIDAFCSHYTDEAVFVSPSGLTKGKAAVLERYKKKYAGKEQMGSLTLAILDAFSSSGAASVAMKWKLVFADDAKKPPAEGFSVIGLVKRGSSWLIQHDASM